MHPARWHLRPLGLRLVRPVGDSKQVTTSGRPLSRLPPAGKWRQSKTSSRRGSLLLNVRGAASQTGCPPSPMSKPLMHPASSTAARSRPTKQLGSATGSPGSLREMASCLPRLLGSRLRLRPSSRLSGQSAQYKMNTLKNTEPTWCLPVWMMIDAAGGCSNKR